MSCGGREGDDAVALDAAARCNGGAVQAKRGRSDGGTKRGACRAQLSMEADRHDFVVPRRCAVQDSLRCDGAWCWRDGCGASSDRARRTVGVRDVKGEVERIRQVDHRECAVEGTTSRWSRR